MVIFKYMRYSKKYYSERDEKTSKSANIVTSLVFELIKPKSVVDFGCGAGTWLKKFREKGVKKTIGIDGKWAQKGLLKIDQSDFIEHNLEYELNLNDTFDLAMSLEVAEHLPKESAEVFVKTLTNHAPVVLFSAAIPFQGGTHHVNEQWPEYWVKLFEKRGYVVIDAIRGKVWNNPGIKAHYAQNCLIFTEKKYLKKNNTLKKEAEKTNKNQLSIVHPYLFLSKTSPENMSLKKNIPLFLKLVKNAIFNKFRKIIKN